MQAREEVLRHESKHLSYVTNLRQELKSLACSSLETNCDASFRTGMEECLSTGVDSRVSRPEFMVSWLDEFFVTLDTSNVLVLP